MGDIALELDLSEHMQRRIFWLGGYNLDILRLLDRRLAPGMVFVDVGANIGELSLFASRRVGPSGRVYAFEPEPSIAATLRRHVEMNRAANVEVEAIALSDRSGELPLYLRPPTEVGREKNDGLATLIAAPGAIKVSTVRVDRFDDWTEGVQLAHLDVLKVDIEGGELAFLEGASESIRRFRPGIVVEASRPSLEAAGFRCADLIERIQALGYRIQLIDPAGSARALPAADRIEHANLWATPSQ